MRNRAALACAIFVCTALPATADSLPAVSARVPSRVEDAMPSGPTVAERLDEIRRRVQEAVRYPAISRERGIGGEVLIAFEIGPDGLPFEITAAASSGSGALDRAAIRAVERAGQLPYVFGRITVPVRFRVREAR
jgi:TonB family protein